MKKIILSLAIALSVSSLSFAQQANTKTTTKTGKATKTTTGKPAATTTAAAKPAGKETGKGPQINWDKTTYDFGNIPQGIPATGTFNFTNTGTAPVLLSNVVGSCGCTVPEWPKEPIMPGKSAVIKATYNAANPGAFNKSITVTANTENSTTVLFIKGDVKAKEQQ